MYFTFDPGLTVNVNFIFTLREPNVYKPHGFFNFGLPRHFHLLLCNCLVLSLFVFCGKSNKVNHKVAMAVAVANLKAPSTRTRIFLKPHLIL